MTLKNKLGITNDLDLAHEEERLSKGRAYELFESGQLDKFEVGTFKGLASIHGYLFQDVYSFAGKMRKENISNGDFRFAPVMYLGEALKAIDKMPQENFDQIIEKYVEMNVAHPFREGNGRSTRLWLDCILKKELHRAIDWSKVDKQDCLSAMRRSPVKDLEIKYLLKGVLTEEVASRQIFMKGLDASYAIEGYGAYSTEELAQNMS